MELDSPVTEKNNEDKLTEITKILDTLGLSSLPRMQNNYFGVDLEKIGVNPAGEKTVLMQYVDSVLNKLKDGSDIEIQKQCLLLENSLSNCKSLSEDIDSSLYTFQYSVEHLKRDAKLEAIPTTSTLDENCKQDVGIEIDELKSELSPVNCTLEEIEKLTKELICKRKELKTVKSKLDKFSLLPPNLDEIKKKISEAENEVNLLKQTIYSATQF